MADIILENINLGGLSDSEYQGIANSVAEIRGIDLHSKPGLIRVAQKTIKDSGSIVSDFVLTIVPCSDGYTYFFGDTGKVYRKTAGGVYSLVHTNTNGKILGAKEYNGYIYYASTAKLGRWKLGTYSGSSWSFGGGEGDNWNSITSDNNFHPMFIKNLDLYIGAGFNLSQVDDTGTFTASALDLPVEQRIKCLGEFGDELLIGCYVNSNINETKIFRWDTWSESWNSDDSVPEVGINSFIPMDNSVVVNAGVKGNLYYYTGTQLKQFKRVPGDWVGNNNTTVHPNAGSNFNGVTLFGLSDNSATFPAPLGVYDFGAYSSNYPKVLSLLYPISTGHTSEIEIGAIAVVGNDILISWVDRNTTITYGVDKIDWSAKNTSAYFTTRKILSDRLIKKTFSVNINYNQLPTGTDLKLYKSVNGASFVEVQTTNDAARKLKFSSITIPDAVEVQFKIMFEVNGNNAPEVQSIIISY